MTTQAMPFIVVYVNTDGTMVADTNRMMVSLIEAHGPAYWDLLNPHGYTVFFSMSTGGRQQAVNYVNAVQGLKARDARFSQYRVGVAEGPLVAVLDSHGVVTRGPLGAAVAAAMAEART